MLIATASRSGSFPKVGKVVAIPSNVSSITSEVTVHWMEQEQAPHKPKWFRFFKLSSKKNAISTTAMQDILLYDFELTKNGALKKKSHEFLRKNIS